MVLKWKREGDGELAQTKEVNNKRMKMIAGTERSSCIHADVRGCILINTSTLSNNQFI